jgi:hypothetical protein
MHPAGQFFRQQRIHHTMALDPTPTGEGGADDLDAEMGLAIGMVVMAVSGMVMGLVDHDEIRRRERVGQLLRDPRPDGTRPLPGHALAPDFLAVSDFRTRRRLQRRATPS